MRSPNGTRYDAFSSIGFLIAGVIVVVMLLLEWLLGGFLP